MTIEFEHTDVIGGKYLDNTGRNGKIQVNNLNKEYFYKLLPGMDTPAIGDLMVVSSNAGFGVIMVTSVDAQCNYKDMAYAVGRVSPSRYSEFFEMKKKRAELRRQLEAKKKELEEIVTWEILAEKDQGFKALLDAYKGLMQ